LEKPGGLGGLAVGGRGRLVRRGLETPPCVGGMARHDLKEILSQGRAGPRESRRVVVPVKLFGVRGCKRKG
jgi:hypothetical protein